MNKAKQERADSLLDQAKSVMTLEAEAIKEVAERLGKEFIATVEAILACQGKVITTGIGKAGAVARKAASTLSTTGTPALYLHPAEGIHGELGTVTSGDLILVFSTSGETEEILGLLSSTRKVGCKIVALTGETDSRLAKNSDLVIDVSVRQEACPLNLTPTCSTTAMLAAADALAIAVMKQRGFNVADYARLHPGGTTGRRLLLQVKDIMHSGEENPTIPQGGTVREAVFVMTSSPLRGVVNVVDGGGRLVGLFTDGMLRRLVGEGTDVLGRRIEEVMNAKPVVVGPESLAAEAFRIMKEREFDNLPVVEAEGKCVGVVDVQDLLKAGIV